MASELQHLSAEASLSMKKFAITIVAALMPILAVADTITLRDGTRRTGTFVGSSGRMITFDESNGARQTFNINQVRSIDFDLGGAAQNARPAGIYADRPPENADRRAGYYADAGA